MRYFHNILKSLFVFIFIMLTQMLPAADVFPKDSVEMVPVSSGLADFKWHRTEGWDSLYRVHTHPAFDSLLTPEIEDSLLVAINERKREAGNVLTSKDVYYIWKPYFEWMSGIDPHYSVQPLLTLDIDYNSPTVEKDYRKGYREFQKKAEMISASVLIVNDTIIVEKSLDSKLKKGDMILSVNGITSGDMLKYNTQCTHCPLGILLAYSFDQFEGKYDVKVLRGGDVLEFETGGGKYQDVIFELEKEEDIARNISVYNGIGYIKINSFYPNNNRLIKLVKGNIQKFKSKGIHNVILDLRGNGGGNGHNLHKLLSIFIDKDSIDYSSGTKIKVSRVTKRDYPSFLGDREIGETVSLPEDMAMRKIPLEPSMYIDGMTYYILMDKGTESMAATFCNTMQYNDAAYLVGEPLKRNAHVFGDTVPGGRWFHSAGHLSAPRFPSRMFNAALVECNISTTQTSGYTKASDGVLAPDIHIPYIAGEYLTGHDAMLEKLLKHIQEQQASGRTYKGIKDRVIRCGDTYVPKAEKWTRLYDIPEHVGLDREMTDAVRDSLLAEINARNSLVDKDSLMTPDIFYIFKPYFDWLRHIDPHYRVSCRIVVSDANESIGKQMKVYRKNRKDLAFNLRNINDTLIVRTSLDPRFRKGDMLLSINGVPCPEILKYNYCDRKTYPSALLKNYWAMDMSCDFEVVLRRGNDTIRIEKAGEKYKYGRYVKIRQLESIDNNIRTYGKTGYIAIPEFFGNNSRLIKIIEKSLHKFREEGIRDVILDMRGNPGGSGSMFDELLSLFIDRDTIPYMKQQKIKLDGTISDPPEDEIFHEIPLDRKRYAGDMKYYVLMDEATGSIAASFCNIMQYNGTALLAGEPLLHNTLKYGETVRSDRRLPNDDMPGLFNESGISIAEFDEYTRAVDGVLAPDIHIPYIAGEYLTGHDAMLEKLLEEIATAVLTDEFQE